jgi:hypothetical protein
MMTQITAFATLTRKEAAPDNGQTELAFIAEYGDERNKEWAGVYPALSLSMNVLDSVAEQFDLQESYLITFQKPEG